MKFQIHDDDLPATGMENQQRKDASDIGFTPSMTTLTLPRTTNQKNGTMSPTSTTTPTMFAPSRDSYDLAVRTVTVQVKFNNSSSENLIKKYYEHEHDDYNESTIHHKNENDKNEHDTNSYGSTTHHLSNENLTNYYENDSGDGYYSNLDNFYYLDDLHYLSDGSDGSVEI